METLQLEAAVRGDDMTPAAIRRRGMIPAVIYGRGMSPVSLRVEYRSFEKVLSLGGRNLIINLTTVGPSGQETQPVMVKEVQVSPRRGNMIHVDFHRISLKEKVHAAVPIALVGEEEVEKRGGIIQHQERQVTVECLPTDIPGRVHVDVSSLEIGDHVTIGDLKFPANVVPIQDKDIVVVAIVAPRRIEEEEAKPAETEERAEPEVVGKKPEKQEEKA
jgi:large subunit ribosomal protein L25